MANIIRWFIGWFWFETWIRMQANYDLAQVKQREAELLRGDASNAPTELRRRSTMHRSISAPAGSS